MYSIGLSFGGIDDAFTWNRDGEVLSYEKKEESLGV
jgi:hypothetical protein